MTLDEMESAAREIMAQSDADQARAWTHDYPYRDNDATKLARALLAVLPVARAAEAWLDVPRKRDHAETIALRNAIDAMRAATEGK